MTSALSFVGELVHHGGGSERDFHVFLARVEQGRAARSEVAAFLVALALRPLEPATLRHFLSYVQRVSPPRRLAGSGAAVNVVGTGGGRRTFNISTTAAFVASAAGARVLKSGSAAHTSGCGSWDVLAALGVPLLDDASALEDMLEALDLAFVGPRAYAPVVRRLIEKAAPLSLRECGPFLNWVGPLLCPFQVGAQLIGVARSEHVDVFADAVAGLVSPRTLVVHAAVGIDELCSIGVNHARWVEGGVIHREDISGSSLGLAPGEPDALEGGTPERNATILREILTGQRRGPARDTVALNAAAMLWTGGVASSLADGLERAKAALDTGRALERLQRARAWGAAQRPRARLGEPWRAAANTGFAPVGSTEP